MLQRWTPNMWIFRLIEVTTAQWRATADADGTPIGDRAHSGHSRWPTGGHSWRLWTGQCEKQICSPILGLCLGASWMSTKSSHVTVDTISKHQPGHSIWIPPTGGQSPQSGHSFTGGPAVADTLKSITNTLVNRDTCTREGQWDTWGTLGHKKEPESIPVSFWQFNQRVRSNIVANRCKFVQKSARKKIFLYLLEFIDFYLIFLLCGNKVTSMSWKHPKKPLI